MSAPKKKSDAKAAAARGREEQAAARARGATLAGGEVRITGHVIGVDASALHLDAIVELARATGTALDPTTEQRARDVAELRTIAARLSKPGAFVSDESLRRAITHARAWLVDHPSLTLDSRIEHAVDVLDAAIRGAK